MKLYLKSDLPIALYKCFQEFFFIPVNIIIMIYHITCLYNSIIFKFREDKSNNVFREIRKCFRKTAKFEFFAKQIIYLESPDHLLQNDI